MEPLYSFSDSQIGNADGDGRAAVRCVLQTFLFRVGSSEGRVGEGGGPRRVCVFGELELEGRRSMRKEPLLRMGREGTVGFGRWVQSVHLEREQ